MARTFSDAGRIPTPPKLKPTWTTWMWLAFGVIVLVATVIGLFEAGSPH